MNRNGPLSSATRPSPGAAATGEGAAHRCPPGLEQQVLSYEQATLLAETFQVLGDPTRVRIVHALALSELCTSDLAAIVGMSESATSHQLRTLRQMQVVRTRREGKLVYYSLDDDHIEHLFNQGLEHVFERERSLGARG